MGRGSDTQFQVGENYMIEFIHLFDLRPNISFPIPVIWKAKMVALSGWRVNIMIDEDEKNTEMLFSWFSISSTAIHTGCNGWHDVDWDIDKGKL